MDDRYSKFNIIWTFDNPGTFKFMVSKLALDTLTQKGCERVQITLWGPTTRLVAEQEQVQRGIRELMDAGVYVVACRASAEEYKVVERLEAFGGIELKKLSKRAVDDSLGTDEKIVMV